MDAQESRTRPPEEQRAALSSSVIYEDLRRRIIVGELPPGTRLREQKLAEEFNVSRIPLREAIPQLEAEGFVTSLPRRGSIVTTLTMRDVEELFEVRLGVEVFATRLAAERVAAGADPAPLVHALVSCEEAIAGEDSDRVAAANTGLHETIMHMCGNTLLLGMLRSAAGRQRWIYRMTGGTDTRLGIEEHRRLCDAIMSGDAPLAESLAYAHIARTRQPTVDALVDRLPPDPGHAH